MEGKEEREEMGRREWSKRSEEGEAREKSTIWRSW